MKFQSCLLHQLPVLFFFSSLILKAFFRLHQIQIVKCLNRGSKQKPGRYRKYAKSKLVYLVHDFNTPLQLAEYFLWTCGLQVCVSVHNFLFTAFKWGKTNSTVLFCCIHMHQFFDHVQVNDLSQNPTSTNALAGQRKKAELGGGRR